MKLNDLLYEELKYIPEKKKWALVSKNTGRVLRYYDGQGKPSDDWVRKMERQIHYFANK